MGIEILLPLPNVEETSDSLEDEDADDTGVSKTWSRKQAVHVLMTEMKELRLELEASREIT